VEQVEGGWSRECPKCESTVIYVSKHKCIESEKLGRVCRKCPKITKSPQEYIRKCPKCNICLTYTSCYECKHAEEEKRLCRSCSLKKTQNKSK
jgi:hypothetical protein